MRTADAKSSDGTGRDEDASPTHGRTQTRMSPNVPNNDEDAETLRIF